MHQYEYWDNGEHYCGKAIWNLDYSCPGWEAKEPEPDKRKILEALKAGEDLPASIVHSEGVTVR